MSYEFQVASDIHIEKLYPRMMTITDFIIPSCKNLILAGDIGSIYYIDQLTVFFESCTQHFDTVIFVPGNNEYYSRDGFQQVTFCELNQRISKLCADTGVIILNNSYIETSDLIIFGSTWWSGIPDQINMRIKISEYNISADEFNCMHYIAKISLNKVLEIKGDKKLIVITHYCPTKLGTMNSHHKKDDFTMLVPYYFSSSEKYLKAGVVDTWIFGHTHVFRDFMFDRSDTDLHTRIISNADPRKKFFRPTFTFSI